MSVLIEGMEMPKDCLACRLRYGAWCIALGTDNWRIAYNTAPKGKRLSDCPLVEVPTPHGDLIDKNALTHEYYKKASYSHLCDCLNNAPTIIESEE